MLLAWPALVAYSRIYHGVHYPGDIIGGHVAGRSSRIWMHPAFHVLPGNIYSSLEKFFR